MRYVLFITHWWSVNTIYIALNIIFPNAHRRADNVLGFIVLYRQQCYSFNAAGGWLIIIYIYNDCYPITMAVWFGVGLFATGFNKPVITVMSVCWWDKHSLVANKVLLVWKLVSQLGGVKTYKFNFKSA